MREHLSGFTAGMAENSAPASGSAAALAVAMSAALAQKVATRTWPRAPEEHQASDLICRLAEIRRRALELAEADHAAVTQMLAEGAPGPAAITVPSEIADLAEKCQEIAADLTESGKPGLVADSIGARELAAAARAMAVAILSSNRPER